MQINEFIAYLDNLLDAKSFKDASYNGLQVAGSTEVKKIATACTASLEAIDAAVESGADTLLVHHGLFWKGADPRLVGNLKERVNALMEANLNLVAYHLPMDADLKHGNNALLAHLLGGDVTDYIVPGDKSSIAVRAKLLEGLTIREIALILSTKLQTRVSVIGQQNPEILLDDFAICSGSGSFVIDDNKEPDFQALITGEANEQTWHMSYETGTTVFVVGHHASEQYAINKLGEFLSAELKLEHHPLIFTYELDTPIYVAEDVAEDKDE